VPYLLMFDIHANNISAAAAARSAAALFLRGLILF